MGAIITSLASRSSYPLRVGVINSMPNGARVATERQFASLLQEALAPITVELVSLYLPSLTRHADHASLWSGRSHPARDLDQMSLDAVIFTGAEPKAARLCDEPFWAELTEAMDLAVGMGLPMLFSCLSAHAAAQHLFGLMRQPLPAKLSGVFSFEVRSNHALAPWLPKRIIAPHSRKNALPLDDLRHAGAEVLSLSPHWGADAFSFPQLPATLFLQGHPEYDADTLQREYKRDLLRHAQDPIFPKPKAPRMTAAQRDGREPQSPPWRSYAVALFTAWLAPLASRSASTERARHGANTPARG